MLRGCWAGLQELFMQVMVLDSGGAFSPLGLGYMCWRDVLAIFQVERYHFSHCCLLREEDSISH